MTNPISIDLPHRLGAEEARRRIDGGIGNLKSFIPGAADVRSAWNGDRLGLQIAMMGQEVNAQIDVGATFVRVELLLPPALAFFGKTIEAGIRRKGSEMLEDRSGRRD
jgi:hypothetical protein